MATMMKEKRREKKKSKDKSSSRSKESEQPAILEDQQIQPSPTDEIVSDCPENLVTTSNEVEETTKKLDRASSTDKEINSSQTIDDQLLSAEILRAPTVEVLQGNATITSERNISTNTKSIENEVDTVGNTYQDLNKRLERVAIPKLDPKFNIEDLENRLGAQVNVERDLRKEMAKDVIEHAKRDLSKEMAQDVITEDAKRLNAVENVAPSAPMLEDPAPYYEYEQAVEVTTEALPKIQSMPLEEAMHLYGGREMADIRAMSEREEAIVEAGPMSGPEHPLVDLLTTFRSSLIAVERERIQLSKSYSDEEKFRKSLWKVEKLNINISEDCPCGATILFKATYEHAELIKERLTVAKLKLEGLLRDVQESYCHHQHAALLAHCQIEELISETIKSNKNEIREALSFILQALKMCDNAPAALATALQRWARVLSAALLDGRDLRQLLYLLHHLFRQTRSVRWAAKVLRSQISSGCRAESARCLALLDLLLARPGLEPALECTEEADESWEEMGVRGDGGAVSEGALRERDLIALSRSFPLRDLVARLVGFTNSDISRARESDWSIDARGVFQASCGLRTLLAVVRGALSSHPTYSRLKAELRSVVVRGLHALAGAHLQARDYYTKNGQEKIHAELETCFATAFTLLDPKELHNLPHTLLQENTAKEYCTALIIGLHDKNGRQLTSLPIEIPPLNCGDKVQIATQAALDRLQDVELSRMVLEFLFQTGIKRKLSSCKGNCEVIAKECLPKLLMVHPYLHTAALHILADVNQMETLDGVSIVPLSVNLWRPSPGEIREVLQDWAQRCPLLLQHLLLNLDYQSLALESQLSVGSWLCKWQIDKKPEWTWTILRRLNVHRSYWGFYDAPPPDEIPDDLFSEAYAVLATAWGHCIPLICSEGVSSLCKIAGLRPADAIHCLGPVMLIMANSPESVSLTPKFSELLNLLLKSGPTIVQRALGLGPIPGADLILRSILKQLDNLSQTPRSSLVSAWLHALWRPSLNAYPQLDTLLLATREWQLFDAHISQLLQDTNAIEHITNAVSNVSTAPMICKCVLRNAHAVREVRTALCPRLLDVLHLQRISGERIHVDNALKQIGANMTAEDLVIYRTATALLSVTPQRPAHLTLWTLFFYFYLQRPPNSVLDTTPPVGPLFFSGIIKSRVLGQLRRKLQEMITYHHNESESLKQNSTEEQVPSRTKHGKEKVEDGVVPVLTQKDLTGESSDSSDDGEEIAEDDVNQEIERVNDAVDAKKDQVLKLKYHVAAENMFKEFLRWFDESDKTRAMPHHADVARFVPEQVLSAAWSREIILRKPLPLTDDNLPPSVKPKLPESPFQVTIKTILSIKDCSTKRSRLDIKSPTEDIDFRNTRNLLSIVDKYLQDIEALAEEWSNETARIMSLDSALWDLVCTLRVKRSIPSVQKQCPNKCKPVKIHIPQQEWCISTGAERGILENRRSAQALTRRLARPRPHAANSTATLTAIARKIRNLDSAIRISERIWRTARIVQNCTPAQIAVNNIIDLIADRWLCHDGKVCSDLLNKWGKNCSSAFQESLCGLLINPRRLNVNQWSLVYKTLLQVKLPSHTLFSYLSKFEMSRWVETEGGQRRELLDTLLTAAQRWGHTPDEEHQMLLELIGVHACVLLTADSLCGHTRRAVQAARAHLLPPRCLGPLARAARALGAQVGFDQLGHLLRELGMVWWEARTGLQAQTQGRKSEQCYASYAPYIAELLGALQRAFTAAAVAMSYAPERVAVYAWSALVESWSPWVSPHPAPAPAAPPLVCGAEHAATVALFVDCVRQIMVDCPGTEALLLQQSFEWAVQTYLSGQGAGPAQETRIQLSALLEGMRALPWDEHQWVTPTCLPYALQVCSSDDREIESWCSAAWRAIHAVTWAGAGGGGSGTTAPLAELLHLFTAMPQHDSTLQQAALLPWHQLPLQELEAALDRYFVRHYSPTLAYHALPHFRVILSASELLPPATPSPPGAGRPKRCACVSRWLCAATAPPLIQHVPAYMREVLNILTHLAPFLEGSAEIEELLGRAVGVMSVEPAASAALPVWQQWVSSTSTSARLSLACVYAASGLTVLEYYAALADAAIKAYMCSTECSGWSPLAPLVGRSPWRAPGPLCARARLHAAYATLRAHAHAHDEIQLALLALVAANLNFKENEVIIALWIVTTARIVSECAGARVGSALAGEGAECAAAGGALLTRWAAEPKHSLLKMVTLQSDDGPTAQHRLLCRLAQCVLSSSEAAIKAYESSCIAVLGQNSDTLSWGKAPRPKHLPRLAIRLYPNFERYFKDELDLLPEE